MRDKYTQEDINSILSRKNSGESLKDIAKDYNTSGSNLSRALKRRGLGFARPWTEEEEALLVQLRLEGYNNKEIAAILDRTASSVRTRSSKLIKEGVSEYKGNYRGAGKYYNHSKEKLLNIISQYPTYLSCPREYRSNIIRIFGTWSEALEAAGMPSNKGSFNPEKITTVYLVLFDGFYKIGITQQSVKYRFNGLSMEYKIIDYIETDFDNASYLEKALLEAVKPYQYIAKELGDRGGKTECFIPPHPIHALEEIFDL